MGESMRKKDVFHNLLVGWGLVALTVVFTGASLLYIRFFLALARQ